MLGARERAGADAGRAPDAATATTRRARATLIEQVGLGDRIDHRPAELSGGENQRVAIARALIREPRLLLCDEPTGNLDRAAADNVAALLLDLHQRQDTILIIVTHSPQLAARLADSVRAGGPQAAIESRERQTRSTARSHGDMSTTLRLWTLVTSVMRRCRCLGCLTESMRPAGCHSRTAHYWRTNLAVVARRRDRGRRARAARCWSAIPCAAACAISCCASRPRPIRRRRPRLLPRGARRRSPRRRGVRRAPSRRRAADLDRRAWSTDQDERPARLAGARLRRGRALLAVSRRVAARRDGIGRSARRRSSARRSPRRSAPGRRRVLVRVQRPSAMPLESLHGQQGRPRPDAAADRARRRRRGRPGRILAAAAAGRRARGVRAARRAAAGARGRAARQHAARVGRGAGRLQPPEADAAALEQSFARARRSTISASRRAVEPSRAVVVESAAGLIDRRAGGRRERAAARGGRESRATVFTYLANTLRSGSREVPYSLVTAVDL